MSDARTQAIRKLSAELITELQNALSKDGGERWIHIAIRKMEQVPDRIEKPLEVDSTLPLKVGNYELVKLGEKVMVNWIFRDQGIQAGGDGWREVDQWDRKEIAKLKRWLNGE